MARLLLALAASLLTAGTLVAGTADLEASLLEAPAPVALSRQFSVAFKVFNYGPDAARHVRAVFTVPPDVTKVEYGSPWFYCDGTTCTFDALGPQQTAYIYFYATAPATAGPASIRMTLSADESDPNADNNSVTAQVPVVAQPELHFRDVTPLPDAPPDSIRTLELQLSNNGAAATHPVVTVDLPPGAKFLNQTGDPTFTCELDGGHAVCRAPSLPALTFPDPYPSVELRYVNPPLYAGGYVTATATIATDETDLQPRDNTATVTWFVRQLFAVTTAADSGPGSLRQAILDANAGCTSRCVVDFRLPGPLPAAGFFTVRPQSPLPPAAFYGSIDGATQADLVGADASKPVVFLDGSQQPEGDGLSIASGKTDVTSLAIGNFKRFGIFLAGEKDPTLTKDLTLIDSVYAGVDPAGAPAPNFRGIVHLAPWALWVVRSVVSHNRASGIAVANGTADIRHNKIEANGASGIYLAALSIAGVTENEISANHDFAIGVDAFQRQIQIARNSIHDNGGGIDYGLNGPTPNAADDSHRQPNYPTIDSVTYDAAKQQTIVRLHVDTQPAPPLLPERNQTFGYVLAELYANASPGAEAERLVGSSDRAHHDYSGSVDEVTMTVDGDLRGQWLTAITQRNQTNCLNDNCVSLTETSEISPPVYVP